MEGRLPTHLEVGALIRAVQQAGGFATVIGKGERDAGTIAIITIERGKNARLWDRMPDLDGHRRFTVSREEDPENRQDFEEYCRRRSARDPDLWLVEIELDDPQTVIPEMVT